ncbi:MAG: MFS transporter [Gammaproteobacteria bacterium]|nr:MFS transporter [Gammaproteobacteria bacterium]MDH4313952.1 MFS transporter [Gammaproteobacteria bacterium]MDH5212685.1 MFS transporter [Gammaproteobacteria bacterium]MDH5499636.1 MFS transporter [Gammaproteobacteria bacterium]
MKHALAPVASLLIGVSILLTGQGLQGTLLPVRATLEGFSTVSIGLMGAAYFFAFTVGCLKGGELVKRVGHVRVFLAMTATASAVPLVHGLVLDAWIWTLLRMLTGFCFAVLYVVIESWLNDRSTSENRGTIFSTYVMITMTVLAAGQMMMLLYDPADLQLFAIASVLVSLAALPVALSTAPSPGLPQTVKPNFRRLMKISPGGSIACLASGFTNGAFWALAPVFTAGLSDDLSLAPWFMTATVIGGAVSQWPLGFLSDRIGRRKVLIASAVAAAGVGAAIVVWGPQLSFASICLLGAAWGAMSFPLYTLAVAHTNDYVDPREYVMVSAGLLLMYGVGAIIGPFVASTAMTFAGATALFLYAAVIHGLLVLYALYRLLRRKSAPSDKHMPFGDALTSAVTASQVYEDEMGHQGAENR